MPSRYQTRSKTRQRTASSTGSSSETLNNLHTWSADWEPFGGGSIGRNYRTANLTFPIPELLEQSSKDICNEEPWDPSNKTSDEDEHTSRKGPLAALYELESVYTGLISTKQSLKWLWLRSRFNLAALASYYLLYILAQTFIEDLNWKITMEKIGATRDVKTCARNYEENQCGTAQIPFIAQKCDAWFLCMSSHPDSVGKIKIAAGIAAEVLAELLEGFIGRLSYKTIAFLSLAIFLAKR